MYYTIKISENNYLGDKMENRYNKKNRRKYSLKVHVVLVTKYRKELLRNSCINNDLKTKIYDICKNNNYQIIAMETDKDHIHLLLSYDTTVRVMDIIKKLKQKQLIIFGKNTTNCLLNNIGRKRYFGQMAILYAV